MEEPGVSRIRDDNRQSNIRKPRPADSGEAMKVRNERRKQKEHPSVTGSIRFYASSGDDKTSVFNRMDSIKLLMGEKISSVSNRQVLDEVFDFYLQAHQSTEGNTEDNPVTFSPFTYCAKEETSEELYISTLSGLRNMCRAIQAHQKNCDNLLDISEIKRVGHAGKITLMCSGKHTFKCDTSPHMAGGKMLVNLRMVHAVMSTGMRQSQYERLCNAAQIGNCAESYFQGVHDLFCDVTAKLTDTCINEAINEEVTASLLEAAEDAEEKDASDEVNDEDVYDAYKGISIMTDARHGWRKNAAQSDIIALGMKTHKVVGAVTITREDDPISQRHELLGLRKLYEQFESKDINIDVHGHDRNSSVIKYLMLEQPMVINANDTWHATKGIAREIKKVTTGTKKQHGNTWHSELGDKAAAIKTHCYYAMKNCGGSAEHLRKNLDNIVLHYQNKHENCAQTSRCKRDVNYEPTKGKLTDSRAIHLLESAIHKLQIYKTPQDFVKCIDTHYVESFNNAVLIYHDKRICFSVEEYKRRTNLSILDWNENVDRDTYSVTFQEDARNPRRRSATKNLKPKTFHFSDTLWEMIVNVLYMD